MKLFSVKNNKLKTIHHQRAESEEALVWDQELWGDRADCEITHRDATEDIAIEQANEAKAQAKKIRQEKIKTLAEKSGNLTATEIQQLLKSLAQEITEK